MNDNVLKSFLRHSHKHQRIPELLHVLRRRFYQPLAPPGDQGDLFLTEVLRLFDEQSHPVSELELFAISLKCSKLSRKFLMSVLLIVEAT